MTTQETPTRAAEVQSNDACRDTLVSAARELGPPIRDNAAQGERDRSLPAATAKALTEAGLFRLCRPRQLAGLEADPITVIEVVEELARHDGSAAWCAVNCGIAGVLQSLTAADGVAEIGAGHDVILNGIIAPSGRAVEVDGGYRVTGRWAFVSNCDHCTWLAPSSLVFKGDTMSTLPTGPEIVMSWIPASDWQIIDTWDTAGLRATGSHDIEVSDVFVPTHRTIPVPLPDPVPSGALFRFPVVGLWSAGLAAVALGVAQTAIDETIRLAETKTPFGTTSTLANRATTQVAVCEALATVRSARALLVEEASRMWQRVQAEASVTPAQVGALRIAATHATAAAANAVDAMYTAAGGSAVFVSNPLQRCLRDVHMITQHHFVAPPTYEMIGKIVLGVESDGFML